MRLKLKSPQTVKRRGKTMNQDRMIASRTAQGCFISGGLAPGMRLEAERKRRKHVRYMPSPAAAHRGNRMFPEVKQ